MRSATDDPCCFYAATGVPGDETRTHIGGGCSPEFLKGFVRMLLCCSVFDCWYLSSHTVEMLFLCSVVIGMQRIKGR